MPPRKRAAAEEALPKPMCDNHPEVQAVHVTSSSLHSPISLCTTCLKRAAHLAAR